MFVVLTLNTDNGSISREDLFCTYYYPAKYKNILHENDVFVYCRERRNARDQRCYCGVGTVGEILSADGIHFCAKLLKYCQFEREVPVFLPNGRYIEQLGPDYICEDVAVSWRNAVRPLSQQAYDYILNAAGNLECPSVFKDLSLEYLQESLKKSVRDYFVEKVPTAIYRIESIAGAIGHAVSINEDAAQKQRICRLYSPSVSGSDRLDALKEYCNTMKMSYSYKPVLIMALLYDDKNGAITLNSAVRYFREYYDGRKKKGLHAEKKKCIYLRDNISDREIAGNILANPVPALEKSGFFFYDRDNSAFLFSPEIWKAMEPKHITELKSICKWRLKAYYSD